MMNDTVMNESMSLTQQSQFMKEKFPPQTSKNAGSLPKDDCEMLSLLMTFAQNCASTMKTLSLIKMTAYFEQNVKNMEACNRNELKKSYAFLLGCEEQDSRVSKYKVEGLRLAIMLTLLKLML